MHISSITECLIEAGTADDFTRLPEVLPDRNAYYTYLTELCASRLPPAGRPSPYAYDAYYAIASEMEQPRLVAFIKMLTIAENTYAHTGSVSPVIWLFRKAVEKDGFHYHMSGNMYGVSLLARDFQRQPGTQSERLADWILSHAINPYLPFGTQTVHSKNVPDLHIEAAEWTRRAEEYGKRKAEEDAAAKARRLARATNHEQTLAEQAKLKEQRDQLLVGLKQLPIAEMIAKILQDSDRPVFFYETLLTSLAVTDLNALPLALREALLKHLEPIKHGKLHKLRKQINKGISGMARDMHSIRFMLDEAKSLVEKKQYDAARDSLKALLKFYNQEAELDGPALDIASGFAAEAESLLEQVLPKCKCEQDVDWDDICGH